MPFNIIKKNPTAGEITSSLTNSTDAAGLHFDGAAGNIDIASPPDLGAFAVYINNGAGYATTTTTMTVDALSAEIPAGTVLTFSGGGEYIVTTTAAASATSIVSTSGLTGAAVADNEGAAYGGANKFSFEFVVQADSWTTATNVYLTDFGNGGRFIIGSSASGTSGNFAVYGGGWGNFGINPLDDFKVHHIVVTIDGTAAVLYDNGNLVATAAISESHGINNCIDARIGAANDGSLYFFNGTMYRARLWNKTLTQAEVTASFENSTVPFADQYGSQTDLTSGSFAGFGSFGTGVTESGGVITGTGAATGNIANKAISLVPNGVYRIDFEILTITAGSLNLNPAGSGGETPARSSVGVYNETLTVPSDSSGSINLKSGTAFAGTVGNISVRRTGCVADYDCAFSNPEISTMVQDRAGAADGTASSGVTQVTKIEQLNSKSARIGNSQATPADGELLVSGNVAATTVSTTGNVTSTGTAIQYLNTGLGANSAGLGPAYGVVSNNSSDQWYFRLNYNKNASVYGYSVAGGGWVYPVEISSTGLAVTGAVTATTLSTFSAGIAFQSATSSTESGVTGTGYTLDKYETGTFTPTFSPETNSFTSITYDSTGGRYTKIGNLVHIQIFIRTASLDVGTATGNLSISGLPFTATASTGGTSDGYSPFAFSEQEAWGGDFPNSGEVDDSATHIRLRYQTASNVASSRLQVSDMTTHATSVKNRIRIAGTYLAA